jgi:hypothetical protein
MGYNKKILSKAVSELGKAKAAAKPKDIKVDPNGYWNPDNHGEPVRIPGNNITMQGVQQPLYGVDNTGFAQMMYPGQDYQFQGDYVDEYPITQAKKGGEKKYSRNLSATNKLFKKNPLVKAKKKKNKKTFDPNAKYYQTGGITTQEEIDAANDAMMKARFAYASTHGNPAAQRMVTAPDQPYMFDENTPGTHYMASMDNYAVPQIQNVNGQLMLDDFGPDSNEAIRFDSPEDAQFFSENYKKIAPDSSYREMDLTPQEIEEYRKGGYIVEYLDDPSIPKLTKAQKGGQRPILYVDPNDPAGRAKYQASADSAFLYNKGLEAKNYYEKLKPIFDKMNLSGNYSTKDFSELAKKYELKQNHHKVVERQLRRTKEEYMPDDGSRTLYKTKDGVYGHGYNDWSMFKPKQLVEYKMDPEIVAKQQQLIDAGYNIGKADGIWGNKSKAAWEEFQQKQRPESIPVTETVIENAQPQVVNNSVEVSNTPKEPTGTRSQTIMEPDPRNPGKFRVKEVRTVKYSKSLDPPRVVYYNPETNQEGVERFQNGGQKDSWGRSLNDKWYGFDPETKKYTIAPYKIDELRKQTAGVSKYDALERVQPQVAESTKPDIAPVQKLNMQDAVNQKAAERDIITDKIKQLSLLTDEDKASILMDPRKVDEYNYLLQDYDPGTIKQSTPQSTAGRAWDIITNPFDAFEYAVRTGDVSNMPYNYNEMRMAGIDPSAGQGANAVGNTLNTFTNLFDAGDKVVRNVGEGNYGTAALEALRFLPGARVNTGAGKYLTTQTPLKNAYKINPWAFKPNPNNYYRMGEGKSFIDDVLETNKIRVYNENSYANLRADGKISGLREDGKIVLKAKTFPEVDTYWAKGVPLDGRYASQNYGDYMIEASNEIPFIHAVNQRTKQKGFWDAPDVNYNNTHTIGNYVKPRQSYGYDIEGKIKSSIGTPLEYNPNLIKFYKQDWLKGYKPVDVPGQLPGSPNALSSADDVVRSGFRGMDASRYEIKNPDYYTQLLNTYDSRALSSASKKFYKGLIETVKKQNGVVTERQLNELERLKTGNFNFGKKAYEDGGIVMDIDESGIQNYIDQGYIVEFDEGGFVPNREVKLISNTPKQLPVAKKEAIPVQTAPTRSFTERPVNLISSPGMTEYAKNILTKREQVPIEELQKRYSTQPEPVAQEPLSFPGIKNLRNANLSTPVISAATQPIAGGMGSQISNVGKAGVVDQSKLSKTEKELAKLDKQNEKLKEVVTPSFIDRLIKSQAQAFSTGPDINKVSDDVNNLVQMGQNYLNRQNLKTSDTPEVSVKPIVNKEPEIKNPIITGDPIYLNDRRYYTQEVVDLNNVKFGYRNRGEYKDINTEAGNVTAFNPFQPKASFNISKIKPSETFIGIDKNGKFKTGTIDSFTSDDLISKTFKNQVIDFVYNSDGTVKLEKRNKDNPNSPVPVVKVMENGKEKIGSLNFLTKSNVKDPHNQFGEIQGGRVILKAGNETILVSGSINDVVTQFKKLKEKTKTPVEIFTLDNGSYNLGIRTKDKKITSTDLKEYDNLNSSGGNFLYLLNTDDSKKITPDTSFKPKSISDVTKVKPVKDIPDFSNLIDSPTARYFKKEIIDKNYSYGMSTDPLLKAKGATGKGLPGEKEIDCSGAICKVLSQKGIKIENPTIDNSAQHFYDKSKPVKWANIKDGDLITMRTSKGKVDHIGFLVIDKKTGKKFIAESSRSFNEGRIVPFKQRIEFLKSKYPDFTYSVRRL